MSDDDSYWLNILLRVAVGVLAVAVIFVIGLVIGAAYLMSGIAR